MDVTIEDLAALKNALITGEREIVINDKRIVYRSVPELREAIHDIEVRLLRAASKKGRIAPEVRQIRLSTRKGF